MAYTHSFINHLDQNNFTYLTLILEDDESIFLSYRIECYFNSSEVNDTFLNDYATSQIIRVLEEQVAAQQEPPPEV